MKILVMGAGAVGAYFGARLQQAGAQVVFCSRGENLRELRRGGYASKATRVIFNSKYAQPTIRVRMLHTI